MNTNTNYTYETEIPDALLADLPEEARDQENINRVSFTYWQTCWKRMKKDKLAMFGIVVIIAMAILAVFGPMLCPYSYDDADFMAILQGPSLQHWFGTDGLGRDVFVRTLYGARISLTIGFVAAIVNMVIGVLYGGIAGYLGGWVDLIMMRIVDIVYSLPDMLIIILLSVVFQERLKPLIEGTMFEKLGTNMISMFIVFGLLYWVSMARLIRGQILTIKNNEYVLAARCIGTKNSRILTRHILPNCLSVIIITTALQVPSAIFTESYLSFLGLGVSAPLTSLGSLANDARSAMQSYPYRLVIPAVLICLIVLALNLLGDGLRDAFDSKLN